MTLLIKHTFLLITLWSVFSCAGPLQAVAQNVQGEISPVDLLAEANDFFRKASEMENLETAKPFYQKALLRFERLIQVGVQNGKVYYNIGNTYFRLNDLGRAIVNYRRALQFIPNDENLHQNLAYAKSQQPDNIEEKQAEQIKKTVLFWHYDLPVQVRLVGFVVMNLLFWGMLTVQLFWARILKWPIVSCLVIGLMLGTSLLYEKTFGGQLSGVLVSREVIAKKGDGQSYGPSFQAPLHAGLEFKLIENRGDWLHIELPDGRRCWVPSTSIEMI